MGWDRHKLENPGNFALRAEDWKVFRVCSGTLLCEMHVPGFESARIRFISMHLFTFT